MSRRPRARFAPSLLTGRKTALVSAVSVGAFLAAGASMPTAAAAPSPPAVASSTGAMTDPALVTKLNAVLADTRVRNASSATAVMEVASGSLLYSRNATTGLTPASNTKLFTAAAAMSTLGENFRYKTEVIYRAPLNKGTVGGYLYLKGYGDPTSMESDYASLARQVRAAGIRTVTGKLGVDTSYFDSQTYNPYWSRGYADAYYAAQIRPLTIAPDTDYDAGTIDVVYKPGAKGKPATISTVPAAAIKAITVQNTTTSGSAATKVSVSRAYGSRTIVVSGPVQTGTTGGSVQISVDHPELVAAAVFRSELAKAGVRLLGPTTSMTIPAKWHKRAAVDYSITLSQLLVPFLKLSNNMHAETLTKTMGAVVSHSGSWSAGLAVTRRYLSSLGVPLTGVRMVDGSGLTRSNTITPRAMVTLLTKVHRASWFRAYYAALPVAADRRRMVGGTMGNRLIGTPAALNAHAKTGSLTGVTALSGYVTGANGRLYAFSMISNYTQVSPRPLENTLVATLAGWK